MSPWKQPLYSLPDASNCVYYANIDPALPMLPAAYPAYKTPDTSALRLQHHCMETSAHGKTGRHSYAYANLNFQMDVYQWSLPQTFLPEVWTIAVQ
jgi:hypothetical protein